MIGRTYIISTNTELILRTAIEKAGRDYLAGVLPAGKTRALIGKSTGVASIPLQDQEH